MKSLQNLQELTSDELTSLYGGGFAYDAGYALRFLGILATGGTLGTGSGSALTDYFLNYRPR